MSAIADLRERLSRGEIDKPSYIHERHQHWSRLFDLAAELRATGALRSIELTDEGQVLFTDREFGIRMVVDPRDERVAPIEMLNFGPYEPELARVMDAELSRARVFLDIGGNYGYYSVGFARRYPALQVEAFEPIPGTRAYLTRNRDLNAAANVSIHDTALGRSRGEIDFYFYPEGSGNASSRPMDEARQQTHLKLPVTTLDAWLQDRPATKPDFIKIDVEGAELWVLEGARETLRRHRPVVACELLRKWSRKFDYHPNDAIRFMREIGYSCFAVSESGPVECNEVTEETVETNYLFRVEG